MPIAIYDIQGFSKLSLGMQLNSKTSQKWLTVAIFQNWQDSCVALWIEIAVILNLRLSEAENGWKILKISHL